VLLLRNIHNNIMCVCVCVCVCVYVCVCVSYRSLARAAHAKTDVSHTRASMTTYILHTYVSSAATRRSASLMRSRPPLRIYPIYLNVIYTSIPNPSIVLINCQHVPTTSSLPRSNRTGGARRQ
jgi:hypothetical protein